MGITCASPVGSELVVAKLLPPEPLEIDHLAAAANLAQRLAAAGGFGTLDIELLQLALQPKRSLLGLEGLLQRRGFRYQCPRPPEPLLVI